MTTDPDNPERLASFSSDVEAAAVVIALKARGIEASTTGGYTAGFRAEAPGNVNVIVRRRDLDRAKQALVEVQKERTDVDWSQIDVGEPEDS